MKFLSNPDSRHDVGSGSGVKGLGAGVNCSGARELLPQGLSRIRTGSGKCSNPKDFNNL